MRFAVFDAFRKAGAPEDEARKAAEALDADARFAAIDRDLAVIESELAIHRWMFGLFFAVQIATLIAVLFKR